MVSESARARRNLRALDSGGAWRQALALASKTFYGKLDEKIPLTGITGTNGKTTTSYLIDSILRTAGKTTMLAGTIEYHLGAKILPAANTTPESLDLHRMLAELDAHAGGTRKLRPWKSPRTRWRWAAFTRFSFTPRCSRI